MLSFKRGTVLNIASIEVFRLITKVSRNRRIQRVNALAPGFLANEDDGPDHWCFGEAMLGNTPLGKLGGDDSLKGAALLLASPAGGHITG